MAADTACFRVEEFGVKVHSASSASALSRARRSARCAGVSPACILSEDVAARGSRGPRTNAFDRALDAGWNVHSGIKAPPLLATLPALSSASSCSRSQIFPPPSRRVLVPSFEELEPDAFGRNVHPSSSFFCFSSSRFCECLLRSSAPACMRFQTFPRSADETAPWVGFLFA